MERHALMKSGNIPAAALLTTLEKNAKHVSLTNYPIIRNIVLVLIYVSALVSVVALALWFTLMHWELEFYVAVEFFSRAVTLLMLSDTCKFIRS